MADPVTPGTAGEGHAAAVYAIVGFVVFFLSYGIAWVLDGQFPVS